VRDERAIDLHAQRKVELHPDPAGTGALAHATRGKHGTQTRREPDRLLVAAQHLSAVVEGDVAERGPRAGRRLKQQRVAQLVALRGERPFLREGGLPVALTVTPEGADVLHDAGFLVVCLLDEEAVVGDRRRWRGQLRRRCLRRRARRCEEADQ
jgi:hypothetical protein